MTSQLHLKHFSSLYFFDRKRKKEKDKCGLQFSKKDEVLQMEILNPCYTNAFVFLCSTRFHTMQNKMGNFLRMSDTCLVLNGTGKMPLKRGEKKAEIYIKMKIAKFWCPPISQMSIALF